MGDADPALIAWETDFRCDEVGDDWRWLVGEACIDAAAIGAMLWSRYRVADAQWSITEGGLDLRCRLGREGPDEVRVELCLVSAQEAGVSVHSLKETHSWYFDTLASDAAEHARGVDEQLGRCIDACRVPLESSGDPLTEACAPLVRELQTMVGDAGTVRTFGFDGGVGAWSTRDAPAYFIELEPTSSEAAPLAVAFDAEDLLYVSVGRQDAHFEARNRSLEEAVASIRAVAGAVIAGRYSERAWVTRVLQRPRLALEVVGDAATTHLATYSSLEREAPYVDRAYAPYRDPRFACVTCRGLRSAHGQDHPGP